MPQKIKLAEALLLRKEFAAKVKQLEAIKKTDTFELKVDRKPIDQTMDFITAQVPKLTASQVTHEYDFYARNLRRVDAVIQRANWEVEVEVDEVVTQTYVAPELAGKK